MYELGEYLKLASSIRPGTWQLIFIDTLKVKRMQFAKPDHKFKNVTIYLEGEMNAICKNCLKKSDYIQRHSFAMKLTIVKYLNLKQYFPICKVSNT